MLSWAAVALPAIATAADAENDATATTVTVSERNLGHAHPRFQSRYTLHPTPDDGWCAPCGADDFEVFTPADVQKTTFSDDRWQYEL